MKHTLTLLALVTLALVLGARVALAHRHDGPAYTARQVQAGLLRHPDRWLGRTLLVRGAVASAGLIFMPAEVGGAARRYAIGAQAGAPALAWSREGVPADLAGPVAPEAGGALVVDQAVAGDGWFGSLVRRLPLLDRLLPERGADGRHPATYRVRLMDASSDPGCAAPLCYHAALLDPIPAV
jgi:hypothetical protein